MTDEELLAAISFSDDDDEKIFSSNLLKKPKIQIDPKMNSVTATSTTEVKKTPRETTITKTVVEPSVKPYVDPSKSKLENMLFPSSPMNPINNRLETMEPWNAGISYEQAKGITPPKYLSEYPKPDMNNGSISNSWLDRLIDFVKTPIGKQPEKNEEYYRTQLINDIAEVEGIKRDRDIARKIWEEEKRKAPNKTYNDPNKSILENLLNF